MLKVTHDAHWIPEGSPNAGRLVGFNNQGVSTTKSSVDQIVTPISGYNYDLTTGSAYEPSTYTRHACNGYTSNAGNSEQLPNGNMLVCVALSGYIYEIDPTGNSIWSKTITGAAQQAHRYNKCFTDNEPPAIPIITDNSSVLKSSSATTYQWYFNGQLITGANSINYTPTKDGIYVVRITDNNGCVYRYSAGYKFKSSGSTFKISGPINAPSICLGKSAQIDITASNEIGSTSYSWTSIPAGFSSSSKNITVSPTVNTTYKVVATNNGIKDSTTILVIVNPKPNKPIITQTANTLTSSTGITYKWYEDTVIISSIITQSYTPAKSSAYRVKITDASGCESDFSDAFSFFVSGVKNYKTPFSFRLFPNPSHGNFTIENDSKLENIEIKINDVYGRTILKTQNLENINMSEFQNGIYLVNIYTKSVSVGTIKLNLIK